MPRAVFHHVFVGERLTAFSDAVFAIVATIMVIPLRLTEDEIKYYENDLVTYITSGDFSIKFLTYYFSFSGVLGVWYTHCKIFRVAEHVDDFLTWLNLGLLLLVSLIPAVVILIGNFQLAYNSLVITLASSLFICISIVLCAMVYVAVRQKAILHPDIARNVGITQLKLAMYLPLLVSPIFGLLAILFAWTLRDLPIVGLGFFYAIGPTNAIVKLVTGQALGYWRKKNRHTTPEVEDIFKNFITKERTLAFSDGIFSIVATLIVLDITTIDISQINTGDDVASFIDSHKYDFISYFSSFMIVGLLWFVHHSMFHFIKKVNNWITIFNSNSLIYVGLIPFGTGVVSRFAEGANTSNEITSIRIMSLLLILASSTQLLLWSIAHCQKSKCLSSEVNNVWLESIQIWKLLIFPIMGLLIYVVTFSSQGIAHYFYNISIYFTPFLFILPRLLINILFRTKLLHYIRLKLYGRNSLEVSSSLVNPLLSPSSPVVSIQQENDVPLNDEEHALFDMSPVPEDKRED